MTTTTPPTGPPTAGRRERGPVAVAADRCIRRLQRGYRQDHSSAVSTLARLRRGAGRPANAVQDLWGLTGTDELGDALAELPEEDRGWFDHDRAEEALHLAVTLWALHQQSHRDADMHLTGRGLGRGVRVLMIPSSARAENASEARQGAGDGTARSEPTLDEPLRRRFVRVGTASSLDSLAQRLREIVLLLRRDKVALDYGLLADQLYRWQHPALRAGVRREWGRDFHLAGTDRGKKAPESN
jgi:CRISPR system Cascade subunit CasB